MWLQSLRYLPTWSASTKDFGQLSKIAVAWETRLRVVALYAKLGWPWVPTWHQSLIFLLLVALLLGATTTNTVSEHILVEINEIVRGLIHWIMKGSLKKEHPNPNVWDVPSSEPFLRHSYCHQIQNSGKLSLQKQLPSFCTEFVHLYNMYLHNFSDSCSP